MSKGITKPDINRQRYDHTETYYNKGEFLSVANNVRAIGALTHSLSPLTWSRRGDMIDTSYDNERQAGLSSANLVRVGLSCLVHSFRLSAQHLTCLPRFLPPSRVPAALSWPGCCGEKCCQTMQVFFIFSLSLTGFPVVLLVPLYLFVQICSSYGPSMRSLTCVCSICSRMLVSF